MLTLVNEKCPDQGATRESFPWSGPQPDGGPSVPIVARHDTSARPEVINMSKKYDVYASPRARHQAKSALARGRRTIKPGVSSPAEIPGQLSIDDVLAEIAAEQAAEGGEQS